MNKTIMILLIGILLVGTVSAFEFDNVKSYDEKLREITISDSVLGIPTTTVGKIKLDSPQVMYVMPGNDRLVAEFTVDLYDSTYDSLLKKLEFFDINKNNESIDRIYWYKYKESTPYDEIIWGQECKEGKYPDQDPLNKTLAMICTKVKNGTRVAYNDKWYPLNSSTFKKGKTTVGIFTNVYSNDNVEWIPTIMGVRIPEWATWTSSFNVGLRAYYPMDDSGTIREDVVAGLYNITAVQLTQLNTSGFHNYSYKGTGNSYAIWGNNVLNLTDFTFSAWYKVSNYGTANNIVLYGGTSSRFIQLNFDNCAQSASGICPSFTTQSFDGISFNPNGAGWFNFVLSATSGGRVLIWINGTLVKNESAGTFSGETELIQFGGYDNSSYNMKQYQQVDEVAVWNRTLSTDEVQNLYNGGAGIFYTPDSGAPSIPPNVTLQSPSNTTYRDSPVVFTCNSTDDVGVVNMTMRVSGQSDYITNGSASATYVNISKSYSLADGTYYWNCSATDTQALNSTSVTNVVYVNTNAPALKLNTLINNATTPTFPYTINFNYTATDSFLNKCWLKTFPVNPSVYYTFDQNTTTTVYDMMHNVDLAPTGTPVFVPGVINNYALQIGNTDPNYMTAVAGSGNVTLYNMNFTIGFYYRKSTVGSTPIIAVGGDVVLGTTRGWDIRFRPGGNMTFVSNEDELLVSGKNFTDGNLHRVLFSRTGPNLKLYVDGILDRAETTTREFNRTWTMTLAGQNGGGINSTFDELFVIRNYGYSADEALLDFNNNITYPCNKDINVSYNITGEHSMFYYANDTGGKFTTQNVSFTLSKNITFTQYPTYQGTYWYANVTFTCNAINEAPLGGISQYIYKNGLIYNITDRIVVGSNINATVVFTNLTYGNYSTLCQAYYVDVTSVNSSYANYTVFPPHVYFDVDEITSSVLGLEYNLVVKSNDPAHIVQNVTQFIYNYPSGTFLSKNLINNTGGTDISIFAGAYGNPGDIPFGKYTYNAMACSDWLYCQNGTTSTFIVGGYQNNQTYNATVFEGSTNRFILNFTFDSTSITSYNASLYYNNSVKQGYYLSSEGTDVRNVYANVIAPPVDVATNVPFYWIVKFTTVSGDPGNITTLVLNQTVKPINISNTCVGGSRALLNFTWNDEDTKAVSTNGTTIELGVNIFDTSGTNLVGTYNRTYYNSSAVVCIDSNDTYVVDYTAKYLRTGYTTKYRIWDNLTLTNQGPYVAPIPLYSTPGLTQFYIQIFSPLFATMNDVVIDVQRYFPGLNAYLSVEAEKTGDDGRTVINLLPGTAIYNYVLYKNGQLLGSFNNRQDKCSNALTGDCSIKLNLGATTTDISDYSTVGGIAYTLLADSTDERKLYLSYASADGKTHSINWKVIKNDGFGNTTICSNSTSSFGSGTLECNVPTAYSNTTIINQLFVDGKYQGSKTYQIGDKPSSIFGGLRVIFGILMYTSLTLLFIADPIMIIFGAILGFIFAGAFLMIDGGSIFGTSSVIIYLILAGVIIIYAINKRRSY